VLGDQWIDLPELWLRCGLFCHGGVGTGAQPARCGG